MSKPQLVLSNATTFFSGQIERVFKKAKKHGFKYLEIAPYRWTNPDQILKLEQQYQIQTVGIHLPDWWQGSLWKRINSSKQLLQKVLTIVWHIYQGSSHDSPGLALLNKLQSLGRQPYLLLHANEIEQINSSTLQNLNQKYYLVIENFICQKGASEFVWNPIKIEEFAEKLTGEKRLVFDPGHLNETREDLPKLNLDPLAIYKQIKPKIIHIGYNDHPPFFHTLPKQQSRKELAEMLKIHQPRYIVIETNPLVSVKKAKSLITSILHQASL